MATPDPICRVCRQPILSAYATLSSGAMTHVRCVSLSGAGRRSKRKRHWFVRARRLLLGSVTQAGSAGSP